MVMTPDTNLAAASCGTGPELVQASIGASAIELPDAFGGSFPPPSTVTFDADVSFTMPYRNTNLSLVLHLVRAGVPSTFAETRLVNIDVSSGSLVVSMTTEDLLAEGDDYYLKSWVVPSESLDDDELWCASSMSMLISTNTSYGYCTKCLACTSVRIDPLA